MRMNVLYTCDNNYVWIMGISLISLYENNRHVTDIRVYLLGEDISDENKVILANIAEKYERKIEVIDVPQLDIPHSLVSSRWPLSAYTRLFSGQLLPEDVDKVLYLDCDTIIVKPIDDIWDIPFGEKLILGVKDCIGGLYKKNIGIAPDDIYINAGVLLLNLNGLRKINIYDSIDSFMKKYIKTINYADQDVLNGMFSTKIGAINPKFDVMTIDVVHTYDEIIRLRKPTCFYTEEELKKATDNPSIIHYTTNMLVVRPWFSNSNHPNAEQFLTYFNISPWRSMKLEEMVFHSSESKTIKVLSILPGTITISLLGCIHSFLRPLAIRIRALF